MAPELFDPSNNKPSRVPTAVDIYAFGWLLVDLSHDGVFPLRPKSDPSSDSLRDGLDCTVVPIEGSWSTGLGSAAINDISKARCPGLCPAAPWSVSASTFVVERLRGTAP